MSRKATDHRWPTKSVRTRFFNTKRAGFLVPLFSLRGDTDEGIGDIATLREWADWASRYGQSILQILPINDLPPGEKSPYSGLSSSAIHPIYVSVREVPDVQSSPEAQALIDVHQAWLRSWKERNRVPYHPVIEFKLRALAFGFEVFLRGGRKTSRWQKFQRFQKTEIAWLNDYARFRALKDRFGWDRPWMEWEEPLRWHDLAYLDEMERTDPDFARKALFYKYVQWIAQEQWDKMREYAHARGVFIKGDLPFGIGRESSDVWGWQSNFDLTRVIGAPPDLFSKIGQNWGLPMYRWDTMKEQANAWWRLRFRRMGSLYDLYRIDHTLGLYRTWSWPAGKAYSVETDGAFTPGQEGENWRDEVDPGLIQRRTAQGEAVLALAQEESPGSLVIGEDLGVIPDYVPPSLERLNIPGYKVIFWEYDEKIGDFRNPEQFQKASVATYGTHDIDPLAASWPKLTPERRSRFGRFLGYSEHESLPEHLTMDLRERLFRLIYESGSAMAMVQFQDFFGNAERINVPAIAGKDPEEGNWTWRVDWTPSTMPAEVESLMAQVLSLVNRSGRGTNKQEERERAEIQQ